MIKAAELTPAQVALLSGLYEIQQPATASNSALPLKARHKKVAGYLARHGLVKIDISRTTMRQMIWLSAAGLRLIEESRVLG